MLSEILPLGKTRFFLGTAHVVPPTSADGRGATHGTEWKGGYDRRATLVRRRYRCTPFDSGAI